MSSPEKIAASFNQLLKDVHGKPEQHVLEQLGYSHHGKGSLYNRQYWPLWFGI